MSPTKRFAIEIRPMFSLKSIDNSFSSGNGRSIVIQKQFVLGRWGWGKPVRLEFICKNTIHLVNLRNRLRQSSA